MSTLEYLRQLYVSVAIPEDYQHQHCASRFTGGESVKMRATMRMLASVKPERFLEAGNPTGLTGLFTHPSPRSTLLYLYNATLEKLKAIPEHSVYRQSTEALITYRFNVVDSLKPPGYDEWTKRAEQKLVKYRDVFSDQSQSARRLEVVGESVYVVTEHPEEKDEQMIQWGGDRAGAANPSSNLDETGWEPEPPLEASQ